MELKSPPWKQRSRPEPAEPLEVLDPSKRAVLSFGGVGYLSLLVPPAGDATTRFAGFDPASVEGPMAGILIVDEAEVFLKPTYSFLSKAGFDPLNASTLKDPVGRARNMRTDPRAHHVRGTRRGLKGALCAAAGFPSNLVGPGERNRRVVGGFTARGETA